MSSEIQTERLRIRLATVECLHAELESSEQLAQAIAADVASDWPPAEYDQGATRYMLNYVQNELTDEDKEWSMWYSIEKGSAVPPENGSRQPAKYGDRLVGTLGFKGPPDEQGIVELGYGLVESAQKKGLATEGVAAFVKWAYRDSRVKELHAQTLPQHQASIGVLQRAGFQFLRQGVEEGLTTVVYHHLRDWLS